MLHIFRDILPCVPILCGRPHAFAIQLVSIMVLEFFAPEDLIIKQGSFSDTLYIMVEGPPGAAEVRHCLSSHLLETLANKQMHHSTVGAWIYCHLVTSCCSDLDVPTYPISC